jgi:hypothetical protein
MTDEQIFERLVELDARIAAIPHWGALLSALIEERRALEGNLSCEAYIRRYRNGWRGHQ